MKRKQLFVNLLNNYFGTPIEELEYSIREFQVVYPAAGSYLDDELSAAEAEQEVDHILDRSPAMLHRIAKSIEIPMSMRGKA